MKPTKGIKKKVETDFNQVFHRELNQELMHTLLNKIQKINNTNLLECTDNPGFQPKKRLSFNIFYEEIINNKVVESILHKHLEMWRSHSKENLSHSDLQYLYKGAIWNQLDQILNDRSYDMLLEVEEFDLTGLGSSEVGSLRVKSLSIKMDMESVDEWFKMRGLPAINIDEKWDPI